MAQSLRIPRQEQFLIALNDFQLNIGGIMKLGKPLLIGSLSLPALAMAGEPEISAGLFTANNVWMMLATGLVFIMHLGFATLETGLTQSKNSVNILFKNTFIVCFGLISYAIIGFNTMYPGEFNGFLKLGFAAGGAAVDQTAGYADGGYTYWTDFLFQGMFAATAATIVSGAVAERIRLSSFMLFTAVYVTFVYPIVGSWKWGGGWLDKMGFYDFAGSTLVHSVGGWAALAGVMLLGPRLGKYVDGKIKPIPGHNLPLAAIGVFLLWLGWFGFNGGSVLSADADAVSLTLMTTSIAGAAGGLVSMFTSWVAFKKPDLSMSLNGILAGLVGITAGADLMSLGTALIIGAIAGFIVVFAVLFFDKVKLDDPVGAISVHLVCGIWGTLAVGIFGSKAGIGQLGVQALGVLAYGVTCFVAAFSIFFIIKQVLGLRVTADEEREGLDLSEHGMEAYADFVKGGKY